VDDTLLLLLNAHHEALPFVLPDSGVGVGWEVLVDTTLPSAGTPAAVAAGGGTLSVGGRALVLLRRVPPQAP
jgi:isoamylase